MYLEIWILAWWHQHRWLQLLELPTMKTSVCIITELPHNKEDWIFRVQWGRNGAKQRAWYCYEENLRLLLNAQSWQYFTSQLTPAKLRCKDRIQLFPAEVIFLLWESKNDISQYTIGSVYYFFCSTKSHDDLVEQNREHKELELAGHHCRSHEQTRWSVHLWRTAFSACMKRDTATYF